jgi:Ribbon-helix-helix protein, copG family
MYIEIDFNLIYQLEKMARRRGLSVADLVNEAITEYIEQHPEEPAEPTPDDAS